MDDTQHYFSVGEFAKQAGVSVRTLQHYDKIGLLKPATRSEGGRRLYTPLDVARLQQILTLKMLGLPLSEIKQLLVTDADELQRVLTRQKQALKEKVRQLEQIIGTIERAEQASGALNLTHFVDIIQEINMSHQTDWLHQFLSDDQQAQLIQQTQEQTLAEQKQTGEAWQTLFQDIQAYLEGDADPARQQTLIARWQTLMETYTTGDTNLQTNLENAYTQLETLADRDDFPEDLRTWLQQMQAASVFASKSE